MRTFRSTIVIATSFFILQGCSPKLSESSYLQKVQTYEKEKQECWATRVLRRDCDEISDKIERLDLEFQLRFGEDTLRKLRSKKEAAKRLGRLDARGNEADSIYSQVRGAKMEMLGLGTIVEHKDYHYLAFDPTSCTKLTPRNYHRVIYNAYGKPLGDMLESIYFIHKVGKSQCLPLTNLPNVYFLSDEAIDELSSQKHVILKRYATFELAKDGVNHYLSKQRR